MENQSVMNRLTFLGTGTSVGIPRIGCDCAVCRSADVHDKRLRCSALLETDGLRILIDCSPDFRQQALLHDIRHLDGVILTHEHYDHVGGLDDLRPLGNARIYGEQRVLDAILRVMPYCFGEHKYPGAPDIELHKVEPDKPFTIGNVEILPLRVMHGRLPIVGYRIGRFAYITDASAIADTTISQLQGLDTLVLNALQIPPHPAHFSLAESLQVAEKIKARRTWFIHFSDKIGLHAVTNRTLPKGVELAYDNLTIGL